MTSGRQPGKPSTGRDKPALTIKDVRGYLVGQDQDALIDLVIGHAGEDGHFMNKLLVLSAAGKPGDVDVEACRSALRAAIEIDEPVYRREAYEYADGVDEAVKMVAGLLGKGHATEAITLSEYALGLIEENSSMIYVSGDYLSYHAERFQEIHLRACRKARPDRRELATRLFELEFSSDSRYFSEAAEKYSRLLGKEGLAEYRKVAEAEWKKVPALGPGDYDGERFDGSRFRLTKIMETLARLDQDVYRLVGVKKRDLSSQFDFLEIAEVCRQAKRYDEALEWAERGLAAFPERPDARLREFLAREYHRRGRHEDAVAIAWDEFVDSPSIDFYRNLKKHADRVERWPEWRERALELMRERVAEARRKATGEPRSRYGRADYSELVTVFLWEKDVEAAWAAAVEGGCYEGLWMQLADLRQEEHPQDSLRVYTSSVDPLINHKDIESYREAVDLLKKIRDTMDRLDLGAEFTGYVQTVRSTHGRKRNLMKLFNSEKW